MSHDAPAYGLWTLVVVHEKAAQRQRAADIAQALCGRQVRQVELGCVFGYQHDRKLSHTPQGSADMHGQYPIGIDRRVVEEAVRGFQLRPRQCLREGALRSHRQPARERDKAFASARIAQVGGAKFFYRPIGVPVRQQRSNAWWLMTTER